MLKFINDTDEDITLRLPMDGGEPSEVIVKPGEEIQIADEVLFGLLAKDKKYVIEDDDAGKTEDEVAAEVKEDAAVVDKMSTTDTEEKTEDENAEEGEKTDAVKEAEAKLSEERAAIARERRELMCEKAESEFKKLCESGRAVPAQKEAFTALYLHEGVAAVAEGESKSVHELLNNLMESAPRHSLLEDEKGKDGEGESEPELTSEDKEVAERLGVSEQDLINHERKN